MTTRDFDRIFVSGLRVETIIGILPHEREQRQPLVIDLELAADIATPAASRNIADALDYKALSDAVRNFVVTSDEWLIETLAERICAFIRNDCGVPWVRLVLHKPDALDGSTDVGIIIERGTPPSAGAVLPDAGEGSGNGRGDDTSSSTSKAP